MVVVVASVRASVLAHVRRRSVFGVITLVVVSVFFFFFLFFFIRLPGYKNSILLLQNVKTDGHGHEC